MSVTTNSADKQPRNQGEIDTKTSVASNQIDTAALQIIQTPDTNGHLATLAVSWSHTPEGAELLSQVRGSNSYSKKPRSIYFPESP